jgi:hypothetical protein
MYYKTVEMQDSSTQGQNNRLPQMLLLQSKALVFFLHAKDNIRKECINRMYSEQIPYEKYH